jgi:hypothetical protein
VRLEVVGDAEPQPHLRTSLKDAGDAAPEPQAAPCSVCSQTHRSSAVYTLILANTYGNVDLESPPASLLHRGNGALRSAMRASAARARAGMVGNPGFAANAPLWISSRQATYGGVYVRGWRNPVDSHRCPPGSK